jgi:uncharacterized RDD family membrane protein YckC
MWKRISAALLDAILIFVVIEGIALLMMALTGFNSLVERRDALEEKYITMYDIDRDMSVEELNALPNEQKLAYQAKVEAANKAYQDDPEVSEVFRKLFSLSILTTTFSTLIAFLILEFMVPLLFKNGQTLGKRIFSIGVIRIDGVKISPVILFARNILGKCTIGTLVPMYLIMMVSFGLLGLVGLIVLGALLLAQVIMFFFTKYHTPIHDKFAQTLTVDISTQLVFDSPEELLEYKKRIAAEQAEELER